MVRFSEMLLRKLHQNEISSISDNYQFNSKDKQSFDWWLNVRIYGESREKFFPPGSFESALNIVDNAKEVVSPLNFSFWDAVNEGILAALQFEASELSKITMQLNNIFEEDLEQNDYL